MFLYFVAMFMNSFRYEPVFTTCVVVGIVVSAITLTYLIDRLVYRK